MGSGAKRVYYELQKHIIVIFHAVEEKDGDNTRLRIKVEGQTKNNVWEPMDLGGFVEMQGDSRTIGFSNCERYFAKGTRGIRGIYKIPEMTTTTPNDFLTKLFAEYNKKNAEEVEANNRDHEAYEAALAAGNAIIDTVVDAETATAALAKLRELKHAQTSEAEVNSKFKRRCKDLKLFYDRVLKAYTPAPAEPAKEGAVQ